MDSSVAVAPVWSVMASPAPRIRAAQAWSPLSDGRSRQWNEREHERELVVQIADVEQARANESECLVWIPSSHGEHRAKIQVQQQEPRAEVPQARRCFVQQTLGFVEFPGRRARPMPCRSARSRCARSLGRAAATPPGFWNTARVPASSLPSACSTWPSMSSACGNQSRLPAPPPRARGLSMPRSRASSFP